MPIQQLSMGWALLTVLLALSQPTLSVLFTVEAERTAYKSPFGGSVVMGCRFSPSQSPANPKITWSKTSSSLAGPVIELDNQTEPTISPNYQGRAELLMDELSQGWAKLKISSLRIHDSGTYQCLLQTKKGADYKTISLSVFAPFKTVIKRVEKVPGADQVLLSCQSEGYPKSSVVWQDGRMSNHSSNTSAVPTPNQLLKITSQIRISATERNNYTCQFTNDGASVTFHIPDEIPAPHVKKDALIIVLCIGVIMLFIAVGVLAYRRRKGFNTHSTRNLVPDGPVSSACAAIACLQIEPGNDNDNLSELQRSLNKSSCITDVTEGGISPA